MEIQEIAKQLGHIPAVKYMHGDSQHQQMGPSGPETSIIWESS